MAPNARLAGDSAMGRPHRLLIRKTQRSLSRQADVRGVEESLHFAPGDVKLAQLGATCGLKSGRDRRIVLTSAREVRGSVESGRTGSGVSPLVSEAAGRFPEHAVALSRFNSASGPAVGSFAVYKLRRSAMDSNKPAQNIQDSFLNTARKERASITIYLLSGVKLTGRIRSFDKYSVVLEANGQEQLIFKHAISTIVLGRVVSHGTHPAHGEAKAAAASGIAASAAPPPAASASSSEG